MSLARVKKRGAAPRELLESERMRSVHPRIPAARPGLLWLLATAMLAAGGAHAQAVGPMQLPTTLTADPLAEKPDKAAQHAYTAGVKALAKAREYEASLASATSEDKRAGLRDKVQAAYGRALDAFTEALGQRGDLVDAWSGAGIAHSKLGAYAEAFDDYNHVLALKADRYDAVEYRAEAALALDRLADAETAYLDLTNHDPSRAAALLAAMRGWLTRHRAQPAGVRAADIDDFEHWLGAHAPAGAAP